MAIRTHAARLGAALLDFVYPPHCPACGCWQAPEDRAALCAACLEVLRRPLGPRCRRCGAPLADDAGAPARGDSGCANCEHWAPVTFDRALVLADFHGVAGAAVHALKFNGIRKIGRILGNLIGTHPDLSAALAGLDILLPVPLHPARQRERGHNQALDIAVGLGDVLEIPVETACLRRVRPTRQQARLGAPERAGNLGRAFAVPQSLDPTWQCLGLVDDVLTTGATLSACATALRAAAAPPEAGLPETRALEIRAIAAASPFRMDRPNPVHTGP